MGPSAIARIFLLLIFPATSCWASEAVEPRSLSPEILSESSKSITITRVRDLDEQGRVRVLRETRISADGRAINHGRWREVDDSSRLVSEGNYEDGLRQGLWVRIHRDRRTPLFREAPYVDFQAPFFSEAEFEEGKLHGAWRIYDAKRRLVSEIHFRRGLRHGEATWFLANGAEMRKLRFRDGFADGAMMLFDEAGSLLEQAHFVKGRRVVSKTEYYDSGQTQLRSSGAYLDRRIVMSTPDDWEHAKLALFVKDGKPLRHGVYTEFHRNGAKALQGEYEHDRPLGRFQWWAESGSLVTAGAYLRGQLNGVWKWWTEDGKIETQGEYFQGKPVGVWRWYDRDGNVVREGRMPRTPRRHTA